jgi:hypothetical protein
LLFQVFLASQQVTCGKKEKMVASKWIASLSLLGAMASGKYIVPGARWRDTEGNLVNAHAGKVIVEEGTGKFWLFGEYKVEGQEEGGGVSVYSSTDLANWEPHGLALGELVPLRRNRHA